jgi:hypothetical protein
LDANLATIGDSIRDILGIDGADIPAAIDLVTKDSVYSVTANTPSGAKLATNGESIRNSLGIDAADIPAAVPPILLGATIGAAFYTFGRKKIVLAPIKLPNAPRGIATISNWQQNRDGSITGFISGSPSFADGEKITIPPITTDAAGDTVFTTVTGSK